MTCNVDLKNPYVFKVLAIKVMDKYWVTKTDKTKRNIFRFKFKSFLLSKAVEFTKIEGKYCVDRYEYFEELQSAKKHCQVSGLCQGVWDEYCDDNGPFRLCYLEYFGYEYEDSTQGDCVYNKTGNKRNVFIFEIINYL